MKRKEFLVYDSDYKLSDEDYKKLMIYPELKHQTQARLKSQLDTFYRTLWNNLKDETFIVFKEGTQPVLINKLTFAIGKCTLESYDSYQVIYVDGNLVVKTFFNSDSTEYTIRCLSSKGKSILKNQENDTVINSNSLKDYMFKKIHSSDIITPVKLF